MNKKEQKEIKKVKELLASGEVKSGSFLEFCLKSYLDLLEEQEQQEQTIK